MLTLFSLVFLIWCFLSTREATYAMSFIPISFPTLKRRRPEKNKYVIYRVGSVRMGKRLCPWSWVRSSAFGLGPYSRPRAQFFPIRTSRPVNNIYALQMHSNWNRTHYKFPCTPNHVKNKRKVLISRISRKTEHIILFLSIILWF